MLNDVVIVLVVVLVAAGLAIIGVLDLLWPTTPRKRSVSASPGRQDFDAPSAREGDETGGDAPTDAVREASPPMRSAAEEAPSSIEHAASPAIRSTSTTTEDDASARADETIDAPAGFADSCRALYDAGRFDDVVSTATPAVIGASASESDAALLWSLRGRALWALHDSDAARMALQSAVGIAPADEKESYQRQLRSIALVAADDLLARGGEASDTAERLELLRSAREWLLASGLDHGSGEQASALITDVERAYWPACGAWAQDRIAAGSFREAFDLASSALGDATLPDDRRERFVDILGEAAEGEVGRLAAIALESVERGRDWDALRALDRAEDVVKRAADAPRERHGAMSRELFRAYTRLGVMRVDGEEFEPAIDPLFRALRISGIDDTDLDETRWAMVRALDGLVTLRAATIREVVASGHGDAAVVQAERLWTLLRSGIAAGAPQEALSRALLTSRELLDELGQRPS